MPTQSGWCWTPSKLAQAALIIWSRFKPLTGYCISIRARSKRLDVRWYFEIRILIYPHVEDVVFSQHSLHADVTYSFVHAPVQQKEKLSHNNAKKRPNR